MRNLNVMSYDRTVHTLHYIISPFCRKVKFLGKWQRVKEFPNRKNPRNVFPFLQFCVHRLTDQYQHVLAFKHFIHLLNIVDPIHWIVYFLPSWWKFYKKREKKKPRLRQSKLGKLKVLELLLQLL